MKPLSIIAVLLVAARLTACALPYKPDVPAWGFGSDVAGYQDGRYGPDSFWVNYSGYWYTSRKQVDDFAFIRAAELTIAHKFKYFAVVDLSGCKRSFWHVVESVDPLNPCPLSYEPPKSYRGRARTVLRESTTYLTAQAATYHHRPGGLVFRAFETRPEGIFVFDAEFIFQSMRAKYGIL